MVEKELKDLEKEIDADLAKEVIQEIPDIEEAVGVDKVEDIPEGEESKYGFGEEAKETEKPRTEVPR